MVGDHQAAALLTQNIASLNLVIEYADAFHHAEKTAETERNTAPCDAAAADLIAHQEQQ